MMWGHPSNSKMLAVSSTVGAVILSRKTCRHSFRVLRRFKCRTCALYNSARENRVSQRMLAHRRHSSPGQELGTISSSPAGEQCTGADSGEPVLKTFHTGEPYTSAHSGELMLETVHTGAFSGDNIAVTSLEDMCTGTRSEETPSPPTV